MDVGRDCVRVGVLGGDVDIASVGVLAASLQGACEGGHDVIVDLSGCAFMDSSGIHALIQAQNAQRANGAHLLVISPAGSPPQQVLEMALRGAILSIFDTRADLDLWRSGAPGPTRNG